MVQREEDGTFSYSGALDFDVADHVLQRIDELHSGDEEIVLDLSGLAFVDVAGCRSLVRAADWLAPPHRITVVNAPPALIETLTLCGWLPHPRLEIHRAAGLPPVRALPPFRHTVLLYAGINGFLDAVLPIVRQAATDGAAVKVAVERTRLEALTEALGELAEHIELVDMASVGANPARIIAAWRDFVTDNTHTGTRMVGIGEPVWPARSPAELSECQLHESLLNTAFADAVDFQLFCPYDTTTLPPSVLAAAAKSHPSRQQDGVRTASADYDPNDDLFAASLPEPPASAPAFTFAAGDLDATRAVVARHAGHAGLPAPRTQALVLAVNEAAANSIRHGGGRGTLRIWQDPESLVCEVRDAGHIASGLVGRERPAADSEDGRGLWLVHHLCDLVQIRSNSGGTAVRMHTRT